MFKKDEEAVDWCARRNIQEKKLSARFQDGCENNISSNQLTIVIVQKSPVKKEPEVPEITEIPENKVTLEKGYYHCVYVMLRSKKETGVDRKQDQLEVEDDPVEEDM